MRSAARRPRDLLFDQQLDSPPGGDRILSDMTASLSIGEYSGATYLSVKTLWHYHEVGLLEPAHVDLSSGYRYYRPDQIGPAPIIRRLRDLEMPVERLKGALDATDLRGQVFGASRR
jgi:hypothetical protein